MTKNIASRFLAGGEAASEADLQKQFAGRVYQDEKSGAIVVLSQAAAAALTADESGRINPQSIAQKLGGSEWGKNLSKIVDPQNPENGYIKKPSPLNTIIFDVLNGKERVLFFTTGEDGVTSKFRKLRGFTQVLIADESGVYAPSPTRIESSYYRYPQWVEGLNTIVFHDEYQIRRVFDSQLNSWRPILPHERRAGEYELLTPRQRMEKAMADLKSTTGYDGSGVWTQGQKTAVDYTDAQGQSHHQELNVYLVHANQNPQSPVAYEVLQDPKTGEMMFTIRASNHQDIKGLNDQQAALVRQAWAYLLAADPQVMQKFWRVNHTMGVAIGNFEQSGSNNIAFGLILKNPLIVKELPLVLKLIVLESFELYGAQFPQDSQGKYIFSSRPIDCLDLDIEVDAAKKGRIWFETYGNGLPGFDTIMYNTNWWINELKSESVECPAEKEFNPDLIYSFK